MSTKLTIIKESSQTDLNMVTENTTAKMKNISAILRTIYMMEKDNSLRMEMYMRGHSSKGLNMDSEVFKEIKAIVGNGGSTSLSSNRQMD